MAKYNWQELEKEFVYGNYKSISAFLKEKKIPKNNTSQNKTKDWKQKKQQKENKIATKIEEKVIELESTKEANKIISVQDTADILLKKIHESVSELNKRTYKKKQQTKTVIYNYSVGKPSKEIIDIEEHNLECYSIIDRGGLKKLTSALKDINDIVNKNDNKDVLKKLDDLLEEQRNA